MSENSHPRLDLDPALLNPIRLSLVSALAARDFLIFKDARNLLALSDSALSKHASALEGVGYLLVKKGYSGVRPQTTLVLTKKGYKAWQSHIEALTKIAQNELGS
ncbi:MAG: ArsR family transcriptional regulator [Actinomycetales bacterium]|nr:MAG: ArsR family transcriptional regulator [Actinomycetales bacterium]